MMTNTEGETNVAFQLYDLFVAAKKLNNNAPIRDAWATLFSIDREDLGNLYVSFSKLVELVKQTRSQVESISGPMREVALQSFTNIERALSITNWDASWQAVTNYLDEVTVYGLKVAGAALSEKGFNQKKMETEELLELQQEAESLIKKVVDSEINLELKQELVNILVNLQQALSAYKYGGLEQLKRVIDRSYGTLMRYGQTHEVTEEEFAQSRDVWTYISRVADVSALIQIGVIALPQIFKMLGA
jgi:hypothetical protein